MSSSETSDMPANNKQLQAREPEEVEAEPKEEEEAAEGRRLEGETGHRTRDSDTSNSGTAPKTKKRPRAGAAVVPTSTQDDGSIHDTMSTPTEDSSDDGKEEASAVPASSSGTAAAKEEARESGGGGSGDGSSGSGGGRTCVACRKSKVKCSRGLPCKRCCRLKLVCVAQVRGRGRPVASSNRTVKKIIDSAKGYGNGGGAEARAAGGGGAGGGVGGGIVGIASGGNSRAGAAADSTFAGSGFSARGASSSDGWSSAHPPLRPAESQGVASGGDGGVHGNSCGNGESTGARQAEARGGGGGGNPYGFLYSADFSRSQPQMGPASYEMAIPFPGQAGVGRGGVTDFGGYVNRLYDLSSRPFPPQVLSAGLAPRSTPKAAAAQQQQHRQQQQQQNHQQGVCRSVPAAAPPFPLPLFCGRRGGGSGDGAGAALAADPSGRNAVSSGGSWRVVLRNGVAAGGSMPAGVGGVMEDSRSDVSTGNNAAAVADSQWEFTGALPATNGTRIVRGAGGAASAATNAFSATSGPAGGPVGTGAGVWAGCGDSDGAVDERVGGTKRGSSSDPSGGRGKGSSALSSDVGFGNFNGKSFSWPERMDEPKQSVAAVAAASSCTDSGTTYGEGFLSKSGDGQASWLDVERFAAASYDDSEDASQEANGGRVDPTDTIVKRFWKLFSEREVHRPKAVLVIRHWALCALDRRSTRLMRKTVDMARALCINVAEILNDYGIYAMFHSLLREAEAGTPVERARPVKLLHHEAPPYIQELSSPFAAVSMRVVLRGQSVFYHNDICTRLFLSTEEANELYTDNKQDVWATCIHPDDHKAFFDRLSIELFRTPGHRSEFTAICKCRDQNGAVFLALIRLRYEFQDEGNFAAFGLSMLPLPESEYVRKVESDDDNDDRDGAGAGAAGAGGAGASGAGAVTTASPLRQSLPLSSPPSNPLRSLPLPAVTGKGEKEEGGGGWGGGGKVSGSSIGDIGGIGASLRPLPPLDLGLLQRRAGSLSTQVNGIAWGQGNHDAGEPLGQAERAPVDGLISSARGILSGGGGGGGDCDFGGSFSVGDGGLELGSARWGASSDWR